MTRAWLAPLLLLLLAALLLLPAVALAEKPMPGLDLLDDYAVGADAATMDALRTRWQAETRDEDWAKHIEEGVEGAFVAWHVERARSEFECRATICRLSLEHIPWDQDDLITELVSLVDMIQADLGGRDGEKIARRTNPHDGTFHLELFFARQGYRLDGTPLESP